MSASEQKIVQYLGEAKATEHALVRVLQSQIAMTPSGSYRSALEKHLSETPKLTDAVVRAEVKGNPSYDVTTTGAADTVRQASASTRTAARKTSAATRRTARKARKVPGVAQVEGQVKGAVAGEQDLAISDYDKLTAEEITAKLFGFSQIDLAKIDSYERKNQNRTPMR
jgi:hypothetical protein